MVTGMSSSDRQEALVAIIDSAYGGVAYAAKAPGTSDAGEPAGPSTCCTALGRRHETCVVAVGSAVTFFEPLVSTDTDHETMTFIIYIQI
eukprot:scaffold223252_cov26-Prasinocladus_malaysianus.AAC.1